MKLLAVVAIGVIALIGSSTLAQAQKLKSLPLFGMAKSNSKNWHIKRKYICKSIPIRELVTFTDIELIEYRHSQLLNQLEDNKKRQRDFYNKRRDSGQTWDDPKLQNRLQEERKVLTKAWKEAQHTMGTNYDRVAAMALIRQVYCAAN